MLRSIQRTSAIIGCQELELPFRQEIMPTEAPLTIDLVIEDIGITIKEMLVRNRPLGRQKPTFRTEIAYRNWNR